MSFKTPLNSINHMDCPRFLSRHFAHNRIGEAGPYTFQLYAKNKKQPLRDMLEEATQIVKWAESMNAESYIILSPANSYCALHTNSSNSHMTSNKNDFILIYITDPCAKHIEDAVRSKKNRFSLTPHFSDFEILQHSRVARA